MYQDISLAEKRKPREGVFSCIGPEGFDSVALRNGFNFPSDTPEWIAVLEDSIFHGPQSFYAPNRNGQLICCTAFLKLSVMAFPSPYL
jgi:hypothetical protein